MATLKDHQNAMVDLLANGSAIPASATRLAHAMHDVLGLLLERDSEPHSSSGVECGDATPPRAFINDVRLAADLPEDIDSMPVDRTMMLYAKLAAMTHQRNTYKARCESLDSCSPSWAALTNAHTLECIHCGVKKADLSAAPPRGSVLIDDLRAELANVTTQRDTYKARCESLEAGHSALMDACIGMGLDPIRMIDIEQAK